MPRGVKGEKRYPKDVYAKIIPHSAHGGVGGDSISIKQCNNFYEDSSSWACSNSSHHNKNFLII